MTVHAPFFLKSVLASSNTAAETRVAAGFSGMVGFSSLEIRKILTESDLNLVSKQSRHCL